MIIRIGKRPFYLPLGHRLFLLRMREQEVLHRYLLPFRQGDALLDVGCGEGYATDKLGRLCQRAVGIDRDREVLRLAHAEHGGSGRYLAADSQHLPFPSAVYQKILSQCVLEHVADDQRALREIRRVARPDGVVALSVDSFSNPGIPRWFIQWQRQRFDVRRFYRLRDLQDKAEEAGLGITDHTYLFNNPLSMMLAMVAVRARPALYPASPFLATVSRRADQRNPQATCGILLATRLVPLPSSQ
jgi:ubiquinone/menaquinone biosynthesis C-methylase UbiE